MDEVLHFLGTHFAQEWGVITGAPIISFITALVMGVALYFALGAYYKHRLSANEAIISILRERLAVGTHQTAVAPENPTQQESIESSKADRAVLSQPVANIGPNIVCARTTVRTIIDPTDTEKDCIAYLATFQNSSLADRPVSEAANITASIVYEYDASTPEEHAAFYREIEQIANRRRRKRTASTQIHWALLAKSLRATWLLPKTFTTNRLDSLGLNSAEELVLAIRGADFKFYALEDLTSERDLTIRLQKIPLAQDKIESADDVFRALVTLTINGRADPRPYQFYLDGSDPPQCVFMSSSRLKSFA